MAEVIVLREQHCEIEVHEEGEGWVYICDSEHETEDRPICDMSPAHAIEFFETVISVIRLQCEIEEKKQA